MGADFCDIITEGFKVPARIHGSSEYQLKGDELKFPDVKSVLSESENEMLRDDINATLEVLRGLDEELGTVGVREYHLEGVFHRLRETKERQGKVRFMTIATVIVLGVIVVLLLCLKYRLNALQFPGWIAAWLLRRRARRDANRAAAYAEALSVVRAEESRRDDVPSPESAAP